MKKLITLIIFAICHAQLFSQHQAVSFTLNKPIAGTGHHYQALEFIDMIPGFEYEAQKFGPDFIAELNPYLLFPPATGITGGPNPGDDGVVGALPAVVNFTADGFVGVEQKAIPVKSALLYPNPTGDFIYLHSNHKQGKIEFYDLSGRLHQSEITKAGKQQISLQSLGKGTYIAVFKVNNQIIHSQKILKHK